MQYEGLTLGLSPTNSTLSSSASASISSSPVVVSPQAETATAKPIDGNTISKTKNNANLVVNSYEYISLSSPLSFENESYSSSSRTHHSSTTTTQQREQNEEPIRSLSDTIRVEIEKLAAKSFGSREAAKNVDETFINSLFDIFFNANFKVENFREIQRELVESNVIRRSQNNCLALAKLGHECFKLGLFSTAECLLALVLNRIEANGSPRLRMATLSTLSACYWRQSKYMNAIECMLDELDLATQLGRQSVVVAGGVATAASANSGSNKNPYVYNKYRIYGNLASAHQRLRNFDQCIVNLKRQLDIALGELNEPKLAINTLNSLAVLHQRLGETDKCRECLLKTLELISPDLKEIELGQLNLLGELTLKQGDLNAAREFFMRSLWLSTETKSYTSEAQALLNLAYIASRSASGSTDNSSSYYERCLLSLNTNFDFGNIDSDLELTILELYCKCFIGLVNSYLAQNDLLNASLYAHTMLDFILKKSSQTKTTTPKVDKYLKYMELNACSKLAICYARQNRPNDAVKLHEREASLAQELNSIFYLSRAYSHIAHILHSNKNYQGAIDYYKMILAKIESSLLMPMKGNGIRDERLIEMIYFTLANIGYCLEGLGRHGEARLMFEEQFEMAKLMPPSTERSGEKARKLRAAALLNLVNLSLYENLDMDYAQIMDYLRSLLLVYEELDDLNGQLFAAQCLAYRCHKEGNLTQAIQFYLRNIQLATRLDRKESLSRALFNASLCYKNLKDFQTAFKLQSDYYKMIQQDPCSSIQAKFVSLGLIAECSFEIDNSFENCRRCLEIHLDRLNLIKSLEDDSEDESKKSKLIFGCLESISKLYAHLQDNQQLIKFKQLQLNLLSDTSPNQMKQKRKLWLELGNLYLVTNNIVEASKYFEAVLDEVAVAKEKDLLVESLAVGNLGLCRQKEGDFVKAIEYFKKQKVTLQSELEHAQKQRDDRELIPIRIDIARADAKIGKCYEALGNSSRAESHLREYKNACDNLLNEYSSKAMIKSTELIELKDQIYVDFDKSLEELGQFYLDLEKYDAAVEYGEMRLRFIERCTLDEKRAKNIKMKAYFNLAKLFAKKHKVKKSNRDIEKSVEYCEHLIELIDDCSTSTDKHLHIEALLLRFDLIYESNPTLALSSLLRAYQMTMLDQNDDGARMLIHVGSLKLKYAVTSRLCYAFKSQSRLKECLETLLATLSQISAEFNEWESLKTNDDDDDNDSSTRRRYIEYLFLLHRRICLVHLLSISSFSGGGGSDDKRIHLLALKHANEALVYLNQQRDGQQVTEFRLASVYYLIGLCHRTLGNAELELEMFACSLDFYENLVPSGSVGVESNCDTLIKDKLIEEDGSFFSIYEEDEETVVKYSDRINKLYQFIIDALIRIQKLREALLVIERHRSKVYSSSLGIALADFQNFEQIEHLVNDERYNCVIYYYFNELESSLNIWLIRPNQGIVRFERIEQFDTNVFAFETTSDDAAAAENLHTLFDVFLRPLEGELEKSSSDSSAVVWIVYDECMFRLPFHLMRQRRGAFMYQSYEVNCVHSLKHMCKSPYNNQIYTRRKITESGAQFLPMKVVSSEEDMNKLVERFERSQKMNKHSEQFDLLLLLVNPEHKSLNLRFSLFCTIF